MDVKGSYLFIFWCLCTSYTFADEGLKAVYDSGKIRYLNYKITNVLQCNITGVPPESLKNYSIKWLKEDKALEPTAKSDDPPKYTFDNEKLFIHRTKDDDIVQYSCVLVRTNNPGAYLTRADIETRGIPTVKIVSQGTFIEGQKLSVECLATGKPHPKIEWKYGNTTLTTNKRTTFGKKNDIEGAVLQIDPAEMTDRGEYTCIATNSASEFLNLTIEASKFVRVKDKLAALWPFMGICAEVVVLCVIIFIYERKRNRAELDESDTDQSPEQKNTPDHGKESVRQRK